MSRNFDTYFILFNKLVVIIYIGIEVNIPFLLGRSEPKLIYLSIS